MIETFVERPTIYPLEHGKLILYETNTKCSDVAFKFDNYVITLMLAGHKSILAKNIRFEFFPGTFFIPQKNVIYKVDIPSASKSNPIKCIELNLDASFIKDYYESVLQRDELNSIFMQTDERLDMVEFVSNHEQLVDNCKRIYERRITGNDLANQMVVTLMIKELLLDLFQTDAIHLFAKDFDHRKVSNSIKKCLAFIKKNINKKITSKQLSEVAGLGLTTFFNKFKKEMNMAPMEYLTRQRIAHAKSFLQNGGYTLKQVAFNSGFKSYEHFCITFKKIEKMTPSDYKNRIGWS